MWRHYRQQARGPQCRESENMEELKDAFMDFRRDSGVGVIILTGAGEKSFIAGADITEMSSASATEAVELITGGEMISTQEAEEMGLVNHVVPPEDLMPKAMEIANSILSRGPEAVRLSLEAIQHGMEMTLAERLDYEANLLGIVFSTEDKDEGTTAFMEKRKPKFQGK